MKICSVDGCGRSRLARGFCATHYWRVRKFGDPLVGGDVRPTSKGGIRKHPLYSAWAGMINRCYNKNNSSYSLYGERGIVVCDEWRSEFSAFLRDMGERPDGMTLDRVDPNGPYSPTNCRWATSSQQRINQSADGKRRQREAASAAATKRHQERAANI